MRSRSSARKAWSASSRWRVARLPVHSPAYSVRDRSPGRSTGRLQFFWSGPRLIAAACPSLDCRCDRAALGHVRQSCWPLPSHVWHRLHDGLRHARSEPGGRAPPASSPHLHHGHFAVGGGTVSRELVLLRERSVRAALGARDARGDSGHSVCAGAARAHAGATRALLRRKPPVRRLVRDSGRTSRERLDGFCRLHRGDDPIEHIDRHRAGARHDARATLGRGYMAAHSSLVLRW